MKSYIKFLLRNKAFTIIEAVGMIVSLAFVIYMGNYVGSQLSAAREHKDYRNIYMLGTPVYPGLSYGFNDAVRNKFPEIEELCGYMPEIEGIAGFEGENYKFKAALTESVFFRIFPKYRFISGSAEALDAGNSIILSESFANRISDGDIVGKTLTVGGREYVVAGVIEDFSNTLFAYRDIIGSLKSPMNIYASMNPFDHLGSCIPVMKVRQGTDMETLYSGLEETCKDVYSFYGNSIFSKLSMLRLDEVFFTKMENLSPGTIFNQGDYRKLMTLAGITLLLLFSAILNYVNLNSALVSKRAREMATRQMMGASRASVMGRYIAEAVSFTSVCIMLSLVIAYAIEPAMNRMIGSPVQTEIRFDAVFICLYALVAVFTGTLSAIVPALLTLRYNPMDVARGRMRADTKMLFSKIFITIQTALAVFLISMSVVMESQFRKSLDREMNSDIEGKVFLAAGKSIRNQAYSLEDRLESMPCVKRIGAAISVPGSMAGGQYSQTASGDEILYRTYFMDSTAFNMLGFRKLADYGTPLLYGVWFGQSAFRATGFDESFHDISGTLARKSSRCGHTAGVIADFPCNASNTGDDGYVIVSVVRRSDIAGFPGWVIETSGDRKEALKQIRETYSDWITQSTGVADEPYCCDYIGNIYRNALKESENQMRLVEIFMALAIMISALGIIAMSSYDARLKTQDMAIRKIFGATVSSEVFRGTSAYMKMTLAASAAGICLAVWASRSYLQQFITRIDNYFWIFVMAFLVTATISFMAVLWQMLGAARTNPAEAIRKE